MASFIPGDDIPWISTKIMKLEESLTAIEAGQLDKTKAKETLSNIILNIPEPTTGPECMSMKQFEKCKAIKSKASELLSHLDKTIDKADEVKNKKF